MSLVRPSRAPLGPSPAAATAGCALVYVLARVVGLVLGPAEPTEGASDLTVQSHWAAGATLLLLQAVLVHGVAGLALAGLAWSLARRARDRDARLSRLVAGSGSAAAAVSLVQVGIAVAAVLSTTGSPAAHTAGLVSAIDTADAVKLVVVAVFVAAATEAAAGAGHAPDWLRAPGWVLACLLPVGAASHLVDSAVLTLTLDLSLVLLLAWVATTGALGLLAARGTARPAGPGTRTPS